MNFVFEKWEIRQWRRFLMPLVEMDTESIEYDPQFLPASLRRRILSRASRFVLELTHQITSHNVLRHCQMIVESKSAVAEPANLRRLLCFILFSSIDRSSLFPIL